MFASARATRYLALRSRPAHLPRDSIRSSLYLVRQNHDEREPLRKLYKDETKKRKQAPKGTSRQSPETLGKWELTVGIEVHAELNTARKLFSDASTPEDLSSEVNSHVAPFDAALPGSQPCFQTATLVPAIRAALALGCVVQKRSAWDRKHYFYQDQPNGYQITQYYEPLALDGFLRLKIDDGIDPSDLEDENSHLSIGIKQIQMEQDTAKTTLQGSSRYLLDLNRVSHPLIEIITLPEIHSPATAAAAVRKIQALLRAVDACVGGMETGRLRADVNVSVKRRGSSGDEQQYAGMTGLGTRTEIKNLSSFKAVQDAVAAERDRQIAVLEAGGRVQGETRGWTGGAETTQLRGKEGQIDYRYMPDPDLGAVWIDAQLVEHLRATLPELPDQVIERAMTDFGLSALDARALCFQDDGERLEFLAQTVDRILECKAAVEEKRVVGKVVANWILHELGGLLTSDRMSWSDHLISVQEFASLLGRVIAKQITARTAKVLLRRMHSGELRDKAIEQVIADEGLATRVMSDEEYNLRARAVMDAHPELVQSIEQSGDGRKIMFIVGRMMREAKEESIDAVKARETVKRILGSQT